MFKTIHSSKEHISDKLKETMKEKKLSTRKIAAQIEGMSHPQVQRVLSKENYTIDLLLKILDASELEILIVPKRK